MIWPAYRTNASQPVRILSSSGKCVTRTSDFLVLPADFVLHQSLATESLSVDTFSFKNDVYVTIAAPSTDSCLVFQWDHIEMNFRTYDNITGNVKNWNFEQLSRL